MYIKAYKKSGLEIYEENEKSNKMKNSKYIYKLKIKIINTTNKHLLKQ